MDLYEVYCEKNVRQKKRGERASSDYTRCYVMASGYDEAADKAAAFFNDLHDVKSYSATNVSVVANNDGNPTFLID